MEGQKIKILQISPVFYPSISYGGGPAVAYEISRMLVQRGHEVTVFTTDANNAHSRLDTGIKNIDGIKVCYFKNVSNSIAYKYKLFLSPQMKKAIEKTINNYDIVHLHDFRTVQNALLYFYARKNKIPYVLQAHGTVSPSLYQKEILKDLYDKIIGISILKGANKLIALTSLESTQYKEKGVNPKNIKIIPNGINLSEYLSLPERGIFRKKYSIGAEEQIVLYLGRIHQIKGIDLLVKAFASILSQQSNVRLVIVGDDDGFLSTVQDHIENFGIESNVLFTGPLYGNNKLEAYVDSNVYVLPSMYETFPISILEACICGLPVIVTEHCGIVEMVDNNVGYVAEYNEKDLMNKIITLLNDKELAETFGRRGMDIVKEHFGWNHLIQCMETLYSTTIVDNRHKN